MTGYDGLAEAEAFLDRLRGLAGGRIYEGGAPDWEQLEKDASGQVRPYAIVLFGEPIPDLSESTLGGITEQPFILPASVQWVAGTAGDLRRLAAAGSSLLLDWTPTPASAPLRPINGGEFTIRDTQDRPTRYSRIAHWPVTHNLALVA